MKREEIEKVLHKHNQPVGLTKENTIKFGIPEKDFPSVVGKIMDLYSPQSSATAEEWLRENYPEFIIHCTNNYRSIPFFVNMLEQYAARPVAGNRPVWDLVDSGNKQFLVTYRYINKTDAALYEDVVEARNCVEACNKVCANHNYEVEWHTVRDFPTVEEKGICSKCGRFLALQGNGIAHQLCECSAEREVPPPPAPPPPRLIREGKEPPAPISHI